MNLQRLQRHLVGILDQADTDSAGASSLGDRCKDNLIVDRGETQSPLRVLHILPSLRPDGGERIAVNVITRLDKRRFEVGIVSISKPVDSDLEGSLAQAGLPVWHLGKNLGFDWRIYPKIHQVFRAFQPAIVHTHMHVLRYAYPSMMIYGKRPCMLHTVQNVAEHEIEWRARALQSLAYRCGVVPIAVSQEVARSVERLYPVNHCTVVWNCVPTEAYGNPIVKRREWRAIHGFHEDDILFVCVARLAPQKNHKLLLKAFASGPAGDSRARLVFVGTGSLEAELRSEASRLGLADRVDFLGARSDIPELLGAMDVFVLSSDWEGSPVALVEAMAAGLPVISTAVGGVPELFENGKEGCLVQPGDAFGLASAMLWLLHNNDARRLMGIAGAVRAKRKFDVEVMVRAYENLYQRASAFSSGTSRSWVTSLAMRG